VTYNFTPKPSLPPYSFTNFPNHALGELAWNATAEHQLATGVASEMIAVCALAGQMAAVQDLVDVQRPNMKPSPTANYFMVVANSGEGKDTASSPFVEGFKRFERSTKANAELARFDRLAEDAAWKAEERVALRTMDEGVQQGIDMVQLKAEYAALLRRRPTKAVLARILHDDATPAGLHKSIAGGSHSVLLYNPEAGAFLNSGLGAGGPFMNGAWDAKDSTRDRSAEGHSSMIDYRITALFMAQPVMLQKFIGRWGVEAKANGLTARVLFAMPPSTQGARFLTPGFVAPRAGIDAYGDRVVELLTKAAERRRLGAPRQVVPFTDQAAAYFVGIFNEFQYLTAPNQVLYDISGHAAKAPEHMARLACAMHTFEGREGPIELMTLQRAEALIRWFVNQFFMMFSSGQMGDPREWDIREVSAAVQKAFGWGFEVFSRNELSTWCEGNIPTKRLQAALVAMVDRGLLKPIRGGGQRVFYEPTSMLVWRPALLAAPPRTPTPQVGGADGGDGVAMSP
jgi:hypothetical protein